MTDYRLTGKTIRGNYQGAPLQSCKPYDYCTRERIDVILDGETYNRAIFERVIWRTNWGIRRPSVIARFVQINGTSHEIKEVQA